MRYCNWQSWWPSGKALVSYVGGHITAMDAKYKRVYKWQLLETSLNGLTFLCIGQRRRLHPLRVVSASRMAQCRRLEEGRNCCSMGTWCQQWYQLETLVLIKGMHSSAKLQSLLFSVLFFCLCDKVYHNQEVRFLLYLLAYYVRLSHDNIILIHWIKIDYVCYK